MIQVVFHSLACFRVVLITITGCRLSHLCYMDLCYMDLCCIDQCYIDWYILNMYYVDP